MTVIKNNVVMFLLTAQVSFVTTYSCTHNCVAGVRLSIFIELNRGNVANNTSTLPAIWSIRLSVRTTDFHSVKTSSTLV